MEERGWPLIQTGKLRHKRWGRASRGCRGEPSPTAGRQPSGGSSGQELLEGAEHGWGSAVDAQLPASSLLPLGRDPRPAPSLPALLQTPPRVSCPPPASASARSLAPQPDLRPRSLAMKGPLLGAMFSRHVKRHPGVSPPSPLWPDSLHPSAPRPLPDPLAITPPSPFPPLGRVPCAYPHPSPLIPYSSSTHCSLLQLRFHPKPLLSPLCPPRAIPGLPPPRSLAVPLHLARLAPAAPHRCWGVLPVPPQVSHPRPAPLGCSRAGLCVHGGVCVQPHSLAVAWVDGGRCSLLGGGLWKRVGMEAQRAAGQPPHSHFDPGLMCQLLSFQPSPFPATETFQTLQEDHSCVSPPCQEGSPPPHGRALAPTRGSPVSSLHPARGW